MNTTAKVTVYSTSTCGICHSLMQWLENEHIAFDTVVVDEVPDGIAQLMAVSDGAIGVPFTTIKHDSQDRIGVTGFDQKAIQTALA